MRFRLLAVSCALAVLAGCSGSGTQAVVEEPERLPTPVNWATHEDFDVTPYEEEHPPSEPELTHDVPPELLSGTGMVSGVSGERAGYRIQIFSSQDQAAANQTTSEAVLWLQELDEMNVEDFLFSWTGSDPPVYQDFRAPYYRVRLGNFLTREQAERVLPLVERKYASAFIAPDRVIAQ